MSKIFLWPVPSSSPSLEVCPAVAGCLGGQVGVEGLG